DRSASRNVSGDVPPVFGRGIAGAVLLDARRNLDDRPRDGRFAKQRLIARVGPEGLALYDDVAVLASRGGPVLGLTVLEEAVGGFLLRLRGIGRCLVRGFAI